jgi:hypothetical protein
MIVDTSLISISVELELLSVAYQKGKDFVNISDIDEASKPFVIR